MYENSDAATHCACLNYLVLKIAKTKKRNIHLHRAQTATILKYINPKTIFPGIFCPFLPHITINLCHTSTIIIIYSKKKTGRQKLAFYNLNLSSGQHLLILLRRKWITQQKRFRILSESLFVCGSWQKRL